MDQPPTPVRMLSSDPQSLPPRPSPAATCPLFTQVRMPSNDPQSLPPRPSPAATCPSIHSIPAPKNLTCRAATYIASPERAGFAFSAAASYAFVCPSSAAPPLPPKPPNGFAYAQHAHVKKEELQGRVEPGRLRERGARQAEGERGQAG
eukprot:350565-Chlamydomonas_euryale.AAC.1